MGEVAVISDEQLAEMEKYAKEESVNISLPILRLVNKDGDPNFGKWMLGRKRNEDGTLNPGKRVTGIIILYVRRQFSYMNMNPDVKNCWSQMYDEYPDGSMFGSTRGTQCTKCEMRSKDRDHKDKCKCQFVVYNIAILEDGTHAPSVAYIAGSSFMSFDGYYKTCKHAVNTKGKMVNVPTFAFVTLLGAAGPRRNGAVVYFEGAFKRGSAVKQSDMPVLDQKRSEIEAYVNDQNAKHGGDKKEEKIVEPVKQQYSAPQETYYEPRQAPDNSGFAQTSEDIDDCPFDVAPVEPVIAGAGAKSSVVDMDEMEAMFEEAGI